MDSLVKDTLSLKTTSCLWSCYDPLNKVVANYIPDRAFDKKWAIASVLTITFAFAGEVFLTFWVSIAIDKLCCFVLQKPWYSSASSLEGKFVGDAYLKHSN